MKDRLVFISSWKDGMEIGAMKSCREKGYKIGGYSSKENAEKRNLKKEMIKDHPEKDNERIAKFTLYFDFEEENSDKVSKSFFQNLSIYRIVSLINNYLSLNKTSKIYININSPDSKNKNDEKFMYGYMLKILDILETK